MLNIELEVPINQSDALQWFVMAPIYNQEAKIKAYLDRNNIVNYLPVRSVVKSRSGRKRIATSPAVNSLLFIYSTESQLKDICAAQPYLYYKYDRMDGVSRKMVVPSKQMEDFIRISNLESADVVYFNPADVGLNLEKGVRVRLHSHNPALDGIEGVYMSIDGRRQKRLVVSLNGCRAVAMLVDIDLIERVLE